MYPKTLKMLLSQQTKEEGGGVDGKYKFYATELIRMSNGYERIKNRSKRKTLVNKIIIKNTNKS